MLAGGNSLNPARAFPAACGGVSEHLWDKKWIEDSSPLAARSFNPMVSCLTFSTSWSIILAAVASAAMISVLARMAQDPMFSFISTVFPPWSLVGPSPSSPIEKSMTVRSGCNAPVISRLTCAMAPGLLWSKVPRFHHVLYNIPEQIFDK